MPGNLSSLLRKTYVYRVLLTIFKRYDNNHYTDNHADVIGVFGCA